MLVLTKKEFMEDREKWMKEILNGSVFIYPTDTIYGIGCNAKNDKAVLRVRQLKQRPENPFSIIAPRKEWIIENCEVDGMGELSRLPGPYTFILSLNSKDIISEHVNPGSDTVGVRIPDNWFSDIVRELNVPIVTTSVNKSGKAFMTSLEDADEDIKNSVDLIIYEGPKKGKPSTIVSFDKKEMKFKLRQK